MEITVDSSSRNDVLDYVDRLPQGRPPITGSVEVGHRLDSLGTGGESVVTESAVAAGRSEADVLSLDNGNPQLGIALP